MSKTDKTVYEIGFNLISTIGTDEVAKEVSSIKDKIISLGGEIISDEHPVLIKLAYEMIKEIDNKNVRFNSAYFGWIKFDLSPEDVAEIKKMADFSLVMLRYIIIKTVRENTLYSSKILKTTKKIVPGLPELSATDDVDTNEEEATEDLPMIEEEVDKKLDELLTDEQ